MPQRGNLRERLQNEGPLMCPRVRQYDAPLILRSTALPIADDSPITDEIEV